jgi:hypothetical protein
MHAVVRWSAVVVAVVVLALLVAYARGPAHHHGNDVGSSVGVVGAASTSRGT